MFRKFIILIILAGIQELKTSESPISARTKPKSIKATKELEGALKSGVEKAGVDSRDIATDELSR